jgi:hypothetical protein
VYTFVVLAAVAALAGLLGHVLSSSTSHRQSRHRAGAAAVPRVAAATLVLGLAALPLSFAMDRTEVALSTLALWWLSLPWLALTSKLAAWAHAAWSHAATGAGAGLVLLAWQAVTQQRPLAAAVGVWALWALTAVSAVLLLAFLREAAAAGGRCRLVPHPAFAGLWAAGAAAALVLGTVAQPTPSDTAEATAAQQATTPPAAAPTSGSSARDETTTRALPSTTTTERTGAATSAARSEQRTARPATTTSPTPRTTTSSPSPTTTTRKPDSKPTTSKPTTSSSTTTSPIDLDVWPTPPNRPHTPPGKK